MSDAVDPLDLASPVPYCSAPPGAACRRLALAQDIHPQRAALAEKLENLRGAF